MKIYVRNDWTSKGYGQSVSAVLTTKGCSWHKKEHGGCTMCGYFKDSRDVSEKEIIAQFDDVMSQVSGLSEPILLKVYTSGSFFDDCDMPADARKHIVSSVASADNVLEFIAESRPEYVSSKKLEGFKEGLLGKTGHVALGLESANNTVLEKCINKGFTFKDYEKAAESIKKTGLKVKTYILQKPMFLTESESIQDVFSTIDAVEKTTDSISINPVAVHSRTPLEQLWKRGEYRPPWLSSVAETFNYAVKKFKCTNLGIVGAGTQRGPHNCRACDKKITAALLEGFEKQKKVDLDEINCRCADYYKELLECEHLFFDASPRTVFE